MNRLAKSTIPVGFVAVALSLGIAMPAQAAPATSAAAAPAAAASAISSAKIQMSLLSGLTWASEHPDAAKSKSPMQLPIKGGKIGTKFGVGGGNWSSGHHTGVDFPVPTGTKILAAADGVVTKAGSDGPYGNAVTITHAGGLQTMYAHMSSIKAKVGDTVKAGDVIGLVGSTGNTTGPHLHFEVIKKGTQVDPERYLKPTK